MPKRVLTCWTLPSAAVPGPPPMALSQSWSAADPRSSSADYPSSRQWVPTSSTSAPPAWVRYASWSTRSWSPAPSPPFAKGCSSGAKSGVDLDKVFQAVTGGAANSWQLENLGSRILKRDFDPGFSVKLMLKDQRLINQASQEMELPMPVSAVARQFFYFLAQKGLGEDGTQSYVKGLEEMAKVTVQGSQTTMF